MSGQDARCMKSLKKYSFSIARCFLMHNISKTLQSVAECKVNTMYCYFSVETRIQSHDRRVFSLNGSFSGSFLLKLYIFQ